MRKLAMGLLLALALLVVPATPSHAQRGHSGGHGGGHASHGGGWRGGGWRGGGWHGGGWHGGGWHGGGWRGGVFIGGPWWWGAGWGPWWGPPYAYPYAYGYYPPYDVYPPDVVEGSSVYIEQPRAPSEERPQGYWYYCASAKAYYPTVQKCPEAWIKVPPAPR